MMSSTEQTNKPKKQPSPQAIEKQKLKTEKADLLTKVKAIDEKIANLTPKKAAKARTVLTENMKLARNVGLALTQTRKTKDGKTVPKQVASKVNFRKACSVVIGLNNVETELQRYHVDSVVREGLALLEKMPKPERVAKPKGEKKPEHQK